jgi:hypothetical protein
MGLKSKSKAMLLVFMCLSSQRVSAETWQYAATENSMDDSVFHSVFMQNKMNYALGFTCTTPSDLQMIFVAPDDSLDGIR